jgi:hypothetical protein
MSCTHPCSGYTENSIIFGYNITTTQDYEFAFAAGSSLIGRVIMTPEEHAVITKLLQRVEYKHKE